MSEVKNGVPWYTSGTATVDVHFPEDRVCCSNCVVFCRYEEAFRRYSCRATGEQILFPFTQRGQMCPIKFEEENLPWH